MLEKQEYVCKICKQSETIINKRTGYPMNLAVDHSHTTGEVRGLLCKHCNLVLGQVEKNPEIVSGCLNYIKELKSSRGTK